MKILKLATILAVAAFGTVQQAQSAGLTFMEVPSDGRGPALSGALWYPCDGRPEKVDIGFDYSTAVKDCPLTAKNLPLIIVSHGVGGWIGNYHGLAEMLADNGFMVAAINHPRDSGQSQTRDPGDIAAMTQRPTDMKRLVDFMLGSHPYAGHVDPAGIGFFGFSRGGNTGLALVGGKPDWRLLLDNCPTYPGNRFCAQIKSGPVVEMESDARIKAAVLVDPAGGSLFPREGLRTVSVPIQLWGSERGGDGLSAEDAASIARNLPVKPDFHAVQNSGHFSFLPPCSVEFAKLVADSGDTELCSDAPGFDRIAFHKQFNADILAFFRKHLSGMNVGVRRLHVPSNKRGATLDVTVWYPALEGGEKLLLGDTALFTGTESMRDAPIAAEKYPLILLSHGTGIAGNSEATSWMAAALAKRGYIVAAPNHPGNQSGNGSASEVMKLWLRPADFTATLDGLKTETTFQKHIDWEKVGALGLSMGGYTALAVAGARIDRSMLASYCDTDSNNHSLCEWLRQSDVDLHKMDLQPADQDYQDKRVRSVVAIDPAMSDTLSRESFADIKISVGLVNLGKESELPATVKASQMAKTIDNANYTTIEDANHFSMLAECKPGASQALKAMEINEALCDDAGGRSRGEIHSQLIDMVTKAFDRSLKTGK